MWRSCWCRLLENIRRQCDGLVPNACSEGDVLVVSFEVSGLHNFCCFVNFDNYHSLLFSLSLGCLKLTCFTNPSHCDKLRVLTGCLQRLLDSFRTMFAHWFVSVWLYVLYIPYMYGLIYVSFFSFFTRWHVPPSRTSAEACLTGWPNARPQGWDKCSVARHHQACLTVCVKCRCCATSLLYAREREREVYKG